MEKLRTTIEALYRQENPEEGEVQRTVGELLTLLEEGKVRAAERIEGVWRVNSWVKEGILLGFRTGKIQTYEHGPFSFADKGIFAPQPFLAKEKTRIVPGGTAIRRGAYIGERVIIMPPSYVNVGAYVGKGTMIDSHVLVGSCAQIGEEVHLSAGTQIGGVLEPPGSLPVIVEEKVFVGGNCGLFDGILVGRGAVLGAGTILTQSTPLLDSTTGQTLRGSSEKPLAVPERAVVVPGARPRENHFLYCPVIVKYRDEKTDAATALEEGLR